MSDHTEIQNLLFDEAQYDSAVNEYKDSQLEFITDFNNGSSNSSGTIMFDTSILANKFICWSESFLQIPINITSSGTAYTAASLIAFKASVLSFIYGINIATTGGQNIVSDNYISIINNLRLLLEKEFEWSISEAAKIMFAKDTATQPSTTMGGTAAVNTSTLNSGFLSRIQMLKQQAVGTTTWSCVLNIPLRYIHDFFAQLNFPTTANKYLITFLVANASNNQLSPFTVDSAATIPAAPTIAIGPATSNGVNLTSCRLYYKSVTFQPEVLSKLVKTLEAGLTKRVYFRCTDTYLPGTGEVGHTSGQLNKLVNSSTIHPLRVWLLAPPTLALSTAGGATNGTFTFPGTFGSCQVLINNSNYYNNPLNTVDELWSALEEQFPGHGSSNGSGSLISYSDFLNTHRLHVFDVSRLQERLANPNAAVSIQLQATRTNSTPVDIYVLVERLQACTFQFSANETKMVIGL